MPNEPEKRCKYEKGKKQLIFVAAEHVTGIKNNTTNTIQWTFDKFHPQVFVLEGFDNDLGTSPSYFINAAANCAKNSFNECGEPYFSMQFGDTTSYSISWWRAG